MHESACCPHITLHLLRDGMECDKNEQLVADTVDYIMHKSSELLAPMDVANYR